MKSEDVNHWRFC